MDPLIDPLIILSIGLAASALMGAKKTRDELKQLKETLKNYLKPEDFDKLQIAPEQSKPIHPVLRFAILAVGLVGLAFLFISLWTLLKT